MHARVEARAVQTHASLCGFETHTGRHRSSLATQLQFGHGKLVYFRKRLRSCTFATEASTVAYRTPERRMFDVKHAWPS
eukprot:247649-Pleurochrysis_carterae.AAC.2